MSYSAGEALVLARVRACTGFSATNTSQANWKLLNHGKADHYAILRQGRSAPDWLSPTMIRWNFVTVIEVWQRYKDDGTTATSLYGNVRNIISGLLPYRKLNDSGNTIEDSNITSLGDVTEMWRRGGGPQWLKQEINLLWQEEEIVTYSG